MGIIINEGMSNEGLICLKCLWFEDEFCNQPQVGVYLHKKRETKLAEGKNWVIKKISCLFKEERITGEV